jgi:hypothetical protein
MITPNDYPLTTKLMLVPVSVADLRTDAATIYAKYTHTHRSSPPAFMRAKRSAPGTEKMMIQTQFQIVVPAP